jgi:hypothetical protein
MVCNRPIPFETEAFVGSMVHFILPTKGEKEPEVKLMEVRYNMCYTTIGI